MNITIIGAGPIGSYAGSLLANAGHSVSIYENHAQVGLPIQCTGILTSDFDEFKFPLDSFLVNTINTIDVDTPHQHLSVRQKDYIVCRKRFDNFFADLARNAGATIFLSHCFLRREGRHLIIKDSVKDEEKSITPDLVIAADGPLSPTAKAYGFYHPERKNYYGVQAIVEGNFEPHTIKTYFGRDVCPGLFAWVAPESASTARVGVATLKNSHHYFEKFMREHHFTAREIQAGAIPLYHPRQALQKDNCYLVGDASGYVKATTLGGLVPGLQQAKVLADCILHHKNYEEELGKVRRRMWLHWKLQGIFDQFNDQDWDRLVTYTRRVQTVLEKHTRDNPFPIVVKALLKEPRFLYFTKYLWGKKGVKTNF